MPGAYETDVDWERKDRVPVVTLERLDDNQHTHSLQTSFDIRASIEPIIDVLPEDVVKMRHWEL